MRRGYRYGNDPRRVSVRHLWNIQQGKEPSPERAVEADTRSRSDYVGKVLFTYSTTTLSKTDRVRFFYGLKGRGGNRGIVEDCNGVHLGPGVVLLPKRYSRAMQDFLEAFGSEYQRMEIWVLTPSRKMRIREAFEKRSVK